MYELKEKDRLIIFYNKADYLQYKDYQENGLKLIAKDGRMYKFNNLATLTDASFGGREKYVLHPLFGNKSYSNIRYMKKYLELIRK